MEVISYKDFVFADEDCWCGLTDEAVRGAWGIIPQIAARRNEQGEITGVTVSERAIPCEVGILPSNPNDFETALRIAVGGLNPLDATPGTLVIELDDATQWACEAIIITPNAQPVDGSLDTIAVTFLTTDPLWHAVTATTVGPTSVAKAVYGGISTTIAGAAPVYGRVRLTPTAADQQITARFFSITNNSDRTMENFPVRVDMGDTYDGSSHAGYSYALLKDGELQRAEVVNYYGPTKSYLWMIVDHLPPGETADYQFLLSDDALVAGAAFNSYTRPAFSIDWQHRTATTPNTTTTTTVVSAYEVNKWTGGTIRALTGTHAGLERTITANTATVITHAAFPTALSNGDEVLITLSQNGKWVYPVRQTERSDSTRGLWWINQGQRKPGDARFDVPGGWGPYLYYDNDDEKNQARWTPVDVGTVDYFAILDADRTWQGATTILEEGGADGITITMPFPITSLKFSHQLKNPNGMATFVVGSREAGGAADFVHEYTNTAQTDTLTDYAATTVTMSSDVIQVYMGLIPYTRSNIVADEIGADWGRDDGTATSGSTSQLNDNTKDWRSDQWIGGSVRIVSGTGAGQQATITDSSPNTLTASFSTAPDSTSRYIVRNKKAVATVRTNDVFELNWDASDLEISTPTAAVDAYLYNRILYVDRATSSTDPPYQYFDFSGRNTVVLSGESIVLDGEQMRAWIEDASGDEVRQLHPWAVRARTVEADGTIRFDQRWLWLTPGAHTLYLGDDADGNDTDLELTYTAALFG